MIKTEEIVFHIAEPCLADWNSMTPTKKGKHCSLCAKQVIDATNLAPEEIFGILKNQKGNACMRMRSELLDTTLNIVPPVWYSALQRYYKKVALFIGLQFLFFSQLKAQVKQVLTNERNQDGVVKSNLKSFKISGTLRDSITQKPIPDQMVILRINDAIKVVVFTDDKGFFELNLIDSNAANVSATIEFKELEYEALRINFKLNKEKTVFDTIYLNESKVSHFTTGILITTKQVKKMNSKPSTTVFSGSELIQLLK